MRHPFLIVLLLSLGWCAAADTVGVTPTDTGGGTPGGTVGAPVNGMPHPDPATCYAIQAGLDGAADLGWVGDPDKAAQLQQSFQTVQFYGDMLALALRSGGSVDGTEQVESNLLSAGKAFRDQAATLGVEIPAGPLNQYLGYTELCARPY